MAPSKLLPGLKERAGGVEGEVLAFTDADALLALQTIMQRRPQVVALERLFAVTPRGAALINRIKADPTLRSAEIRVVEHNSDYSRIVPRAAPKTEALDQRGTRRAPRFRMVENVDISLDGQTGRLIDLSTVGAQVISRVALKPNQRVSMTLSDETAHVTFNASVAWTSFEMSSGAARFRAGMNFEDADSVAVDAFSVRHRL